MLVIKSTQPSSSNAFLESTTQNFFLATAFFQKLSLCQAPTALANEEEAGLFLQHEKISKRPASSSCLILLSSSRHLPICRCRWYNSHSQSFTVAILETMVVTVLLIVLVALAVAAAGAAEEVSVACHPTWEKTGIPREHTDKGSCTIVGIP